MGEEISTRLRPKRPKPQPIEIDLTGYLPLVIATKCGLDGETPDKFGLLETRLDGTLKVRVSHSVAPRALAILQSVLAGVERRGWAIQARHGDVEPAIRVKKEAVRFYVIEESKLIKHKQPGYRTYYTRNHEPNGRLRLGFDCMSHSNIDRKSWADGRQQRVEEFVDDFLDAVGGAAEVSRQWNQKWQRERRKTEGWAKRVREEAARRQELAEQANALHGVTKLREIIAELRRRSLEHPESWNRDAVARWINWAEMLIKEADPFSNGYFERILTVKRFHPEIDMTTSLMQTGQWRPTPYKDPFVSGLMGGRNE
jgi:hypothetical protein